MEWETPVWNLYARVSSQWRIGFGGRTGLDYGPAIALIEAKGWDVELALDLLRVIEGEELDWDESQRKK